MDKEKHIYTTC